MLIMGNPPAMEARDGLQDTVEIFPAFKPLSKYIKKVTDAADLPVIVRQAIKEASTGRFGPAVLDLAQTAMYQTTSMKVEPLDLPSPPTPSDEDVAAAWATLVAADRPVLYVGAGVHIADAAGELRELAEVLQIPVVSTSWGGRGLLPDMHDLYCGPSGNFGWRSANDALQQADAWLAIGTSFSQMSTGSWSLQKPETVVHVDADVYEVGKIFQAKLGIVSDAKAFLRALLKVARGSSEAGSVREKLAPWRARVATMKTEWRADMDAWFTGTEVPINPYFLIRTLSDLLPEDALVVADSGGKAFDLIDNNHCLLANRASAKASGMDNPWVELPDTTDFVQVAAGFGIAGERVVDPADLPAAIQRALQSEGSYLLDVHTEPGLRSVRALSNIIPIVGDRTPKRGHLAEVIEGSWPS